MSTNATGPTDDPYDLDRFVQAQEGDYERALSEIGSGRKRSHWMWYIFPQYEGLGFSSTSRRYIAGGAAVLVALMANAFRHLAVEDQGDVLAIRFGPLPLFRRTVRYADIEAVEVGRTWILEGWGVHMSPRGGWVWNLWGRDCVVVHLTNGTLRIGTDDAENLAAFLHRRMGERGT